jgi:DNA invertase Pin-like site-specific DNA recombinase
MARVRVVEDAGAAGEAVTALYLRVTAEESVKTDLSLPNQRRRGIEICTERAWSPVKVYQEPRHVGGDQPPSKRPALAALLADIEAGQVRRVLVRHDDRLWRSTEVQDLILNALRRNTVELWTFAGQRELRSAGGRFAIKVLGAAAELEKGLTSERIREMKRGKAHAGRLGGGPPSFGYASQSRAKLELLRQGVAEDEAHRLACEKYPVAKTWYLDDKEAEVVRLIFKLYIDDRLGTRRISQELNRLGHRRRSGLPWCPVKVGRIVNNPALAGLTSYDEDAYAKGLPSHAARYQQQLFPGQHPAIIPVERWREAQHLKNEENAKHVRTRSSKARIYPLTGVLRCGVCGGTMSGRSSGTKRAPYYVCSRRKHYGPTDGCTGPSLPMRLADEAIWDYLGGLFRTPESLQALMDRVNRELAEHAPEFEIRLREVRSAMSELEAKERRWMEKYETATDDAAAEIVWQRIRELKNQELDLRREAEGLEERLGSRTKRQLSLEETAAYLERLKVEPTGEAVRKRAFVEKLRRFHDLDVRVLDARRMAVFMRLDQPKPGPKPEAATEAIGRRIGIIGKAATTSGPSHVYPGKPDPGGPTKSRLWPPAAAISSARRATSWPRISARSALEVGRKGGGGTGADRSPWPCSASTISPRCPTGTMAQSPPTTAASLALSRGTNNRATDWARA